MSGLKPNSRPPRWMQRLQRDFVGTLDQLGPGNSPLMVALSGGADSVALTMLLARETIHPLVLAHFNHGLRGVESDQDAQFVSQLAENLQSHYPGRIRHVTGSPTTPLLVEKGNLEANARRARYSWLIQKAHELGCGSILTGHHAQDQAETVLFHILRGTGPLGLKGIAAKKTLAKNVILLRPLLEFSPESLRSFLVELGQNFREDSSNHVGQFTRNRLRREVIPQLAAIMGRSITPNLARVAWHTRYLHKNEMAKLRSWISNHAQFISPTRVSLPVIELKKLGKYSAMGILVQIAKILNWPRRELSRNHFMEFWNQIQNGIRTITFPQGLNSSMDVFGQSVTLNYSPLESTRKLEIQ